MLHHSFLAQRLAHIGLGGLAVAQRRGRPGVPQELLGHAQIQALLAEPVAKAVPELVRADGPELPGQLAQLIRPRKLRRLAGLLSPPA